MHWDRALVLWAANGGISVEAFFSLNAEVSPEQKMHFMWIVRQWHTTLRFARITACRHLANAYEQGNGVMKSQEMALSILSPAAFDGDADCQFRLGMALYHGLGAKRNVPAALFWVHKAAMVDNAKAQHRLGNMLSVIEKCQAPKRALRSFYRSLAKLPSKPTDEDSKLEKGKGKVIDEDLIMAHYLDGVRHVETAYSDLYEKKMPRENALRSLEMAQQCLMPCTTCAQTISGESLLSGGAKDLVPPRALDAHILIGDIRLWFSDPKAHIYYGFAAALNFPPAQVAIGCW